MVKEIGAQFFRAFRVFRAYKVSTIAYIRIPTLGTIILRTVSNTTCGNFSGI